MHVFGLAMDEKTQAPVLNLKDELQELALPIWIGAMEGMAISIALNKVEFDRPMTHDLLLLAIEHLGGQLVGVDVTRLEEGTFYAEMVVERGEETLHIDCRPSDAIALAVRCGAVIRVAEAVLDAAGIRSMEGYEEVLKSEDAEKWTEELAKFDPDEKYKM